MKSCGILRIGIAVENIDYGKFSDLQGHRETSTLPASWIGPLVDGFLLAAEAEGVAQEQSRGVVGRVGEAGLLRLAVGRSRRAPTGIVEAEALQQFGVVIDLAAFPEPALRNRLLLQVAWACGAGVRLFVPV